MSLIEKTAWKIKFYKNASDEGGAMKKSIDECSSENIVIHSQTKKMGRMWGNCSQITLLKLLETNKGIYEVITKFPHKVYFDIDGKDDCPDLSNIKNIILDFFPNAIFAISGSITPEKKSYHIILQNYIIHNEDERIQIKSIVKYINNKICSAFDWKVYTKNRNMKCIGQSKIDGRIQQNIENEDLRKHLITCFIDNYSLSFPNLPEEIEEHIKIEKAKGTFDLGQLPKLLLASPELFNISTATPIEILGLLPLDKINFPHDYTHLVARYCFYRDISFETFLSWLQKKHNPLTIEIKQKWQNHWSKINKFPNPTDKRIESILVYYYPNILKDRALKAFANSFILNSPINKIYTLSQQEFTTNDKYIIYNIGMGGGKTTQTINYLKTQNNFIWLCPNIALANNTLHRLEQENIPVKYYQDFSAKEKKDGVLLETDKLIICINSLYYISNKKTDVVVIDEIETLLDKFLGDFMDRQNKKKQIWDSFKFLLKNAKKVFLLDAFITQKTISFIKMLEQNTQTPIIYERLNEPITRNIIYMANEKIMLADIIQDLKNHKKCFIYYPYKKDNNSFKGMDTIKTILEHTTCCQGQIYNADVDDFNKRELKNVNYNWAKYDFIITNNIVTCGVNYEKKDYDNSYIFIANFSCPRDIIQVSYRLRHLKSNEIKICFLGKMTQQNTFITDYQNINCSIYENLIKNILIEKESPIRDTIKLFCEKAHYKQKTNSQLISDELHKYIKDLLDNSSSSFSYNTIEDINEMDAEWIQNKMMCQTATMREKFQLKKYFFKLGFKKDAWDIQKNDRYTINLQQIWDENYIFFFERMKKLIENNNNLFNKITKLSKKITKTDFFQFIPNEDIFKIKLNKEFLDEIFSNFHFKYLTKSSSTSKILQEIYNLFFGRCIIKSNCINKNTIYSLDYNENLRFQNFAYKYMKYNINDTSNESEIFNEEENYVF
jgi:hypothetical protein